MQQPWGHAAALGCLFTATWLSACGGGATSAVTGPAAPTIGLAAAGDSQVSITFTAPTSDGGSTITGYQATCTSGTASTTTTTAVSPAVVAGLANGQPHTCSIVALNAVGSSPPSAAVSVTPAAAPVDNGGGNNNSNHAGTTAGVACGISGSDYNSSPSVNLTATYSWTCTSTSRVLSANGVPNHPVGTFPGPGNPNTMAAVPTAATYAMSPTVAASPTTVITSGYGINGVKMEPATAGTCGDAGGTSCNLAGGGGAWNIEALGQSVFNFGVDGNNAHVQPNGAYHYHGMPEGLISKLGGTASSTTLVGWAPDGFPIYARDGNARSSYRLKSTPNANRPATSAYPMGSFSQDYEYIAGLGDLDECNGRSGVTPEFPEGIYHYVITSTYPYIGRCVKGTPASIR